MERYISNPNIGNKIVNTIEVYEGGTGGTTLQEVQDNLDILDIGKMNKPDGVFILSEGGLIGSNFEGGFVDGPTIDGPIEVKSNQTTRFFITNYDINTTYNIQASKGTITREGESFYLKLGSDVGPFDIVINNTIIKATILPTIIETPAIIYPLDKANDINSTVEIRTSSFSSNEVGTFHSATDWQISTTSDMTNLFKAYEKSTVDLTSLTVSGLQQNTSYYIRFRYYDNLDNFSEWSTVTEFKAKSSFAPFKPEIISPFNGAFDLNAEVQLKSNNYFSYEPSNHATSDWQLSTDVNFSSILKEVKDGENNLQSWTIGDLSQNTTYYARVRYNDSMGRKSDWSATIRFSTKVVFTANTPYIINPVTGTENLYSSVDFSSSVFSSSDVRVTHQSSDWEISTDSTFQTTVVKSYLNTTDKVFWKASGLQPNTSYFARVRYHGTLGYDSDWSTPISFKTKTSFNPTKPSIINPTNGGTNVGSSVELKTSDFVSNNNTDTHFNSDWEISGNSSFTTILFSKNASSDNKTSWNVSGLLPNTQYFVRARHRSSLDGVQYTSDWSNVSSFNTKQTFAPGKPSITTPVSGASDVSTSVNIGSSSFQSGDTGDNHLNSDWELATDSGFTTLAKTAYANASYKTLWQVTDLVALRTYFVRVRHRSSNNGVEYVSEWSSASNFTVKNSAPAKPAITSPTNGAVNVGTEVILISSSFVAGQTGDSHLKTSWEISKDMTFATTVYSLVTNGATNTLTAASLENSKTYYVRIKHFGSLGTESTWSDTVTFTTKAMVVSQAPSISSPTMGETRVSLTPTIRASNFSSSSGTDTHVSSDWQLSTDSGFGTIAKSVTDSFTDKTSWTPSTLENSREYFVRVRYKGSESGLTAWSTVSRFTTKPAVVSTAPTITTPTNNSTGVSITPEIVCTAFSSNDTSDLHESTDWEMSTDSEFKTIFKSDYKSTSNKTIWKPTGLSKNVIYYVRVRQYGSISGATSWSASVRFTTVTQAYSQVPTITSPLNNAINVAISFQLTSSEFNSTSATDTHSYSDWEISTSSTFSPITSSSYNSSVNKTTWTVNQLAKSTTYYVRVRYVGSESGTGEWSSVVTFKTVLPPSNEAPKITNPVNNATDVNTAVTFSASEFVTNGLTDTHFSSDWEISKTIDFATTFKSAYNSQSNKTTWIPGGLQNGTTYYVRVRYFGTESSYSSWSTVVKFTTGLAASVLTPEITKPTQNAVGVLTNVEIESSAFSPTWYTDTHISSDWEISTNSSFSSFVYKVYNSSSSLVKWVPGALSKGLTYYVRVRHRGSEGGLSEWSNTVSFKTVLVPTNTTPTITFPTNNSTNVAISATVTTSDFVTTDSTSDTHQSTDWELSTTQAFTSTVKTLYSSTTQKTSWPLTGTLEKGKTYYVRARHTGNESGASEWSTPSKFTTVPIPTLDKPSISSPVAGSIGQSTTLTIISSSFVTNDTENLHVSTDWDLATNSSFTSGLKSSYNDTTNKLNWKPGTLEQGTLYYVRVRYKGSVTGLSEWSNTVSFTTAVKIVNQAPTITSPANNATNVATNAEIVATAFSSMSGTDTHTASDWQLSKDSSFSTVANSVAMSSTNLTRWTPNNLERGAVYYVRARYYGSESGYSDWSSSSKFTMIPVAVAQIPTITAPTNNSTSVTITPTITTSSYSTTGLTDIHDYTDWEISTSSDFSFITKSLYNSKTSKTSWSPGTLGYNTTYYVRARHVGTEGGISGWSTSVKFTTRPIPVIQTPSITSPANGAVDVVDTPTLLSSSFQTSGSTDTHYSSDWELSTSSSFTTIDRKTYSDTANLTSWTPSALSKGTKYYARVKHSGAEGGSTSWSSVISFTTKAADPVYSTNKPTITSPLNNATSVSITPTITSSAFSSTAPSDTHVSSSWELSKFSDFSTLSRSDPSTTVNKTSWTPSALEYNTVYYVRVKHTGQLGGMSVFSDAVKFTTAQEVIVVVQTPSITSPANNTITADTSLTVTSSNYSSNDVQDTHISSSWEMSTTSSFSSVIKSLTNSTTSLKSWTITDITSDATYYVRVKYTGSKGVTSSWSSGFSFVRNSTGSVNKPSIVSPTNQTSVTGSSLTITSSSYGTTAVAPTTHIQSSWEISESSSFGTVVKSSYNSTTELTTWNVTGLTVGKTYYVRVRYNGSPLGYSSWSDPVSFYYYDSSTVIKPSTPSISAIGYTQVNTSAEISLTGSSFSTTMFGDTRKSSEWEFSTSSTFATIFKKETVTSTANTLTSTGFNLNTTYYVRLRHVGNLGGNSDWSNVRNIYTQDLTPVPVTNKPSVTSPTNGQNVTIDSVTVTTSAFSSNYTGTDNTHSYTIWEFSNTSSFSTVLFRSDSPTANNKTNLIISGVNLGGWVTGTTYYIRVKHVGSVTGESAWSDVVSFVKQINGYIYAPTKLYPEGTSATGGPRITVVFDQMKYIGDVGTHASTDWEMSKDSTFSTGLISVYNDTSNLTYRDISFEGERSNYTWYIRARYNGSNGVKSAWSTTFQYFASSNTPVNSGPNTPTVTSFVRTQRPDGYNFSFFSSSFSSSVSGDTHISTDWQVSSNTIFTAITDSSTLDTENSQNLLVFNALSFYLANNTYYVRVRYRGSKSGYSNWSQTLSIFNETTTPVSGGFTDSSIYTPFVIYPAYNARNVPVTTKIVTTAFTSTDFSETHASTDWIIRDERLNIVYQSYSNSTNKTVIYPTGLEPNKMYSIDVYYNSSSGKKSSFGRGVFYTVTSSDINDRVYAPIITTPTQDQVYSRYGVFYCSNFVSKYSTDTIFGVDWEVSTSSSFTTVLRNQWRSNGGDSQSASFSNSGTFNLQPNTTYYIRVRWIGKAGVTESVGAWSETRRFKTSAD